MVVAEPATKGARPPKVVSACRLASQPAATPVSDPVKVVIGPTKVGGSHIGSSLDTASKFPPLEVVGFVSTHQSNQKDVGGVVLHDESSSGG